MLKSHVFLPITKVDAVNRLVYGTMTEEVLDKAGEVFDYATSKPLFEKWSAGIFEASGGKSYGNVRAMHTSKAAGKLIEPLSFDDDAKRIDCVAKVVDDDEWRKVEEGVYTGYSIGGSYAKQWKDAGVRRFTAEPSEVSLVDNPCVPTATFKLIKADGVEEEQPFQIWQPDNTAVADRARDLAKGAAVTDELVAAARDQLIKEYADEAMEVVPADDAEKTAAAAAEAEVTPPTAGKAELAQVWKTSDGQTFSKKADALAHEEAIAKIATAAADKADEKIDAAADKSAPDRLDKGLADLQALLKGNPEPASLAAIADDLAKWGVALSEAEKLPDNPLRKDLYGVSRFAEVLSSLASICRMSFWEKQSENDDSAVPAEIFAGLTSLGQTLVNMAQEEVAELATEIAGMSPETSIVVADLLQLSAAVEMVKADDALMQKAGARNSKADQSRVQAIHDSAVEMGASCGDAEKVTKAATDLDEAKAELAKVTDEKDALVKRYDEMAGKVEGLVEDVRKLKAVPMPPAPKTHVVEKSGAATVDAIAEFEKLSPDDKAIVLIKLAQQSPKAIGPSR